MEKNDLMMQDGVQRYAMNSLPRRNLAIAGVLCLIVTALIVAALRPKHASGSGTGAPPDVLVAQVEQKDVPIYSEWIGTLAGEVNANVQAQVTGYLLRRDYQEGSLVRKGQLLFEIHGPFRRLSTKPKDS
jgi:multidrug efflux pump subunit AcrA (membrane-fusion protein)